MARKIEEYFSILEKIKQLEFEAKKLEFEADISATELNSIAQAQTRNTAPGSLNSQVEDMGISLNEVS